MPSELEVRLDPLFFRDEPQLLEPPDLGLREVLERELGQRRTAPELERTLQKVTPLLGVRSARIAEQ